MEEGPIGDFRLTVGLRVCNRCGVLVNFEGLVELLLGTSKLGPVVRDGSLECSKPTDYMLLKEGDNQLLVDASRGLYFHPTCEVLFNGNGQKLLLTFVRREQTK